METPLARASATLLLPALVCAGCGAGPGDEAAFRVEMLEGIPHSVAADAPEQPDAPLELLWTAPGPEELLDGSAWANPARVWADLEGVAVLDPQLAQVHLFSLDGVRAGSIGRPGEGPGELSGPTAFSLHGDTVIVQNGPQPVLQLLGRADGTYLGSLGGSEGMSFDFHHLGPEGIVRSIMIPAAGQAEQRWVHLPLDGADGEESGHTFELPGTHPLQPQHAEGEEGCWRRGAAGPHLVEADCTFPLLRVLDRSGEIVREHRIEREPERTPEATLTRIGEEREETMRSTMPANAPPQLEQVIQNTIRDMIDRNRWVLAIRGVTGSPSGERLVLWEQLPSEFEPTEATLHLLDAEGRYLQRHDVEGTLQAVAITDDRLYLLVPDPETDLRRLEAYALP